MGRKYDITEKLTFAPSPVVVIKGVELQLDDSASTVLKLMSRIGNGDMSTEDILASAELLFGKDGLKKLDKLKLCFSDFTKVITECADIIVGGDESGEAEEMLATT